MSDSAFMQDIATDPTDAGRRRIYADWLEEQGRGEDAMRQRYAADAVIEAMVHALTQEIRSAVSQSAARRLPGNHGQPILFERGVFKVGNLEVTATGMLVNGTRVAVDGNTLHGVRGVFLHGRVNDIWHCEVDFMPGYTNTRARPA